MNFMEAVKAMKQGKKVRRKNSDAIHSFILFNDNKEGRLIWNYKQNNVINERLYLEDIEATDWEIYEEEDNWNLADTLQIPHKNLDIKYFKLIDIKTFIQKVKEDIMDKDGDEFRIDKRDAHKIIDKRSGNL